MSQKIKRIRSKFKEPHVTRTKSFARLIDEETKRNGVRPSQATTYRQSRIRKDGSIVNAFTAEVVDKLQYISDASSGTSTQMGDIDWTNDELAKIKGREKGGRVWCLGKVVMAKGEGSCSTQDQLNTEAANDSCSAFEHRPNVNPTSSRASQNHLGSRNKGKH